MTRADGRAPDRMRPVRIRVGVQKYAEGSALIELGDTRVLCAASLEEGVPAWLRGEGRGWVTAEYGMLPRATAERTPREATRGRPSGRTLEIQRLVGRSLRAAFDLRALGERTLWIDCDVLQADGGTRTAAVTGGFVAAALAAARLVESGVLAASPVREFVAATSVGIVGEELLLDLDYGEDSTARFDMNVVATASGRLVEVQGTAEGEPVARETFEALLDLALRGVARLVRAQRRALGRHAAIVGAARGGSGAQGAEAEAGAGAG